MSGSDSRLSGAVTAHALIVAGLNVCHSLRTRGLFRTLLFVASGNGIPLLGELLAVNVLKMLRHHARPQVGGVPLAIIESIAHASDPHERRSRALAPAVALAATNFDLLLARLVGVEWRWLVRL